jgi:hypothetical protein
LAARNGAITLDLAATTSSAGEDGAATLGHDVLPCPGNGNGKGNGNECACWRWTQGE